MTVAAFGSAGQHLALPLCDPSAQEWIALATRLRHRVRAVKQKKDRDLLVWLPADIRRPMNTISRLLPLDLSRRDLDALALTSVTALNREEIAVQDHCHSLKMDRDVTA